jgi:pimeloyl-ACP methyl ester carboxylesterase
MVEDIEQLGYPIKYVQVEGARVHYAELGDGPPVVLLHGLGGSFKDWSENVRAISRTHRVYALDIPGFGLSPVPDAEIRIDLEFAAGFVRSLVDQLELERVCLVGNSMGGGISLRFALDNPERTAGLVLCNAVGLGRRIGWRIRLLSLPGSARLALPFASKQTVRQVWESMLVDPTLATGERVEHTWQWLQKPGTRDYLSRIYRHGVTFRGQKELLVQELAGIKAPTLIVWGAQDEVLPVSHAYRAHQFIQNSVLHVLPECGHVPQIEKALDFNRLMHEFLTTRVNQEQGFRPAH